MAREGRGKDTKGNNGISAKKDKFGPSGIEKGNKAFKNIKYIEEQQKIMAQEKPKLIYRGKKKNYFVEKKYLIDFIENLIPIPKGDDVSINSDPETSVEEDTTNVTESAEPELKDFQLIKLLSKGGFGKVYLAKNTLDGEYYAMKRIRKDVLIEKRQIENTLNEKRILSSNDNPFLLSMHYCYQSEYRLYFFMDFVKGKDLYHNMFKAKKFNEEQVKFYVAQLVIAFSTLHKNKIMHRDLKPENVLLGEDGYIVLADFGLAKILDKSTDLSYTQCGTKEYLAPEIIKGEAQTFTVDWWTLGILMYELIKGETPYRKNGSRNKNIVWPDPKKDKIYISDEMKHIISRLLDKDPDTRLGVKGAWQVMAHEWFSDIDFEQILNKKYKPTYFP